MQYRYPSFQAAQLVKQSGPSLRTWRRSIASSVDNKCRVAAAKQASWSEQGARVSALHREPWPDPEDSTPSSSSQPRGPKSRSRTLCHRSSNRNRENFEWGSVPFVFVPRVYHGTCPTLITSSLQCLSNRRLMILFLVCQKSFSISFDGSDICCSR